MDPTRHVEEAAGVNDMVTIFNEKIKSALDRVAPTKTFKIRSQHRFGLSDDTKELMKRRDRTRQQINKSIKRGQLSYNNTKYCATRSLVKSEKKMWSITIIAFMRPRTSANYGT